MAVYGTGKTVEWPVVRAYARKIDENLARGRAQTSNKGLIIVDARPAAYSQLVEFPQVVANIEDSNLSELTLGYQPPLGRQVPDFPNVRKPYPVPVGTREAPQGLKGALWAVDPDHPENADILFFSRYPTEMDSIMDPVISVEGVPGRSMPVIQRTGAKGQTGKVELFFYNAFLDLAESTPAVGAQLWMERYITQDTGGGLSGGPVSFYYQIGNSEPFQIEILKMGSKMSMFNYNDVPQSVRVQLEFVLYKPVTLVSPFKPRAPKLLKRKKRRPTKDCGAGTVGQTMPVVKSVTGNSVVVDARVIQAQAPVFEVQGRVVDL